jgi:tetratricopeptide (TPR) repeat protein
MVLHDLAGAFWLKGDQPATESPLREAYAIARRLLGEGHTQTGRIVRTLARSLRFVGREREAAELEQEHARQRLVELNRDLEARGPDPVLLRSRGEALLDRGALDKAMADFEASLRIDPDDADTLADRAALLARTDRVEAALVDYSRSLSLVPNNADRLAARAEVFERLGRLDEARADFRRALELSPWDYQWRTNLAVLELLDGRRDRYRENCALVVERQHGNVWPVDVVDRTIRTCQLDADPVQVAERNRRAFECEVGVPVERSAYAPWVWETKGLMEYRAGHYPEAVKWLAKAREHLPWPCVRMTIDLLTGMSRLGASPGPLSRQELARLVADSKETVEKQDPGPFVFDLVILKFIRVEAEELLRNKQHPTTETRPAAPAAPDPPVFRALPASPA